MVVGILIKKIDEKYSRTNWRKIYNTNHFCQWKMKEITWIINIVVKGVLNKNK